MSFIFGHLIGAWLAGKGYELLSKRKISHYAWFFLLVGGILPDMDFLADWVFGTQAHRTITHSLLFVLIAPLVIYFVLWLFKDKERGKFALVLGAGILVHVLIDFFSMQGTPLFWPSPEYFSLWRTGLYDSTLSFMAGGVLALKKELRAALLDMALGVAWIFYLWFRRRVRF